MKLPGFFSTTDHRDCQERILTYSQLFPSCEMCYTPKVWEAAGIQWTSEHSELQWRERSGGNISKTSLEKGSWNKKKRKYWTENKHLAVKFGSVKLLLWFSFFEREKDFFFLYKNNYQILISNTTAFFTWRIFILSRIRVKIKLLLLFWRWVLCKLPFLTGTIAENINIICWHLYKTLRLYKLLSVNWYMATTTFHNKLLPIK